MTDTTDNTTTPAPPPAPRRSVRVLLVASLALNLLVLGAVGGALWHGGPHHEDRAGRHHSGPGGPLTRALSDKDRHAILKQMRATRDRGAEGRARLDAAMTALVADLRAQPFDRDAAARHLSQQRAMFSDRIARGQTLLLDRLAGMTHAERAAYADRLQEALETPRRGHERD